MLFGKLDQAKQLVAKSLDLLGMDGSKDIVELREALIALNLTDIEVDVTSTKLLMNEELIILRNSTHNAKLIAAAAKAPTPVLTARSSVGGQNSDSLKILTLEDENANLRGMLEQAKSKLQANAPGGVLITTAVASLNQNFANECDILKAQISQKNSTISQQTATIAGLEKEVVRLNNSYAEAKKAAEETVCTCLFIISRHTVSDRKFLCFFNLYFCHMNAAEEPVCHHLL